MAAAALDSAECFHPCCASYQQSCRIDFPYQIYRHLAQNHTWQVPTLILLHNYFFMNDPALASDPRLKYIWPELRNPRNSLRESVLKQTPVAQEKGTNKEWERVRTIIRDMHRAGVPILAGTDVPNLFLYSGFSLHDELALFVEVGLTPMEALQTATRNAAQYLEILGSYGTVEKGKVADLVALDADPMTDIRNTQRISGVMTVLADVEALANPK